MFTNLIRPGRVALAPNRARRLPLSDGLAQCALSAAHHFGGVKLDALAAPLSGAARQPLPTQAWPHVFQL